MKANDQSAY
ncbi:Protein of unknown function [Bacillus wiedmannii]|nr:Protein of unknown function [Bacillus wiedmannii]